MNNDYYEKMDRDRRLREVNKKIREREHAKLNKAAEDRHSYYDERGRVKTINDPAIAARYRAQERYFGMNKFQQGMAKLTGQYDQFKELWEKSGRYGLSDEEKKEMKDQFDGMFGGKSARR